MTERGCEVRKGYTGYEKDSDSGLEFAQARYYNTIHGRFTSVDPLTASASIRNPQTFNRYSYVLNSPYKYSDPLGLSPKPSGISGFCDSSGSSCYDNWITGIGGFANPPEPPRHTNEAANPPATEPAPAAIHEALHDDEQVAKAPELPPIVDYYINRDGTVTTQATSNSFSTFYIQSIDQKSYNALVSLDINPAGLVLFPDSSDFFNRYSGVDTGGFNNGVKHGKGDHYLLPEVAAALFGVAAVLKDTFGITVSFGDMSADTGTDPWSPGAKDHVGHGHGDRSGMDIDFRYINKAGVSFNGVMNDTQFSVSYNQTVYAVAENFGFKRNFQGKMARLRGITPIGGHNDHGHLGFGR